MRRSFVFLFLLLTGGLVSAQTVDCASLTHRALELSGFNQSIDQMSEMLSSEGFMQQMRGRESSEEFIAVFKPILQKEFNAEMLRKELLNRVAARCNAEQMAQTVQRLQSPLVARMLAMESVVNSPEGQQKLKRYINIAKTVPPTDDRMDTLDALDDSMGATDFATDSMVAVLRGMLTGAGAPPEIVAQIQAHRKDLKTQIQNTIELSLSVTYHGVTRPDLQQYAKELAAQPLKGFYGQAKKAFVEIMEERSLAMGRELKKQLTPPTT